MNKQPTYHSISTSILLAFVINLLLPAALGAAQLLCENAPFVHAERLHTECCISADPTPDITHSSCSLEQICEQALENGLNKTAVFPANSQQFTAIPPLFTSLFNPDKYSVLQSLFIPTTGLPVTEDIYKLHGAFLN